MRHRPTIGPIQAPRHAPLVTADFGRATRELHGRLIVRGDPPGSIRRVNRRRQSVEQVANMPASVAELALVLHLLFHIPLASAMNGASGRASPTVSLPSAASL